MPQELSDDLQKAHLGRMPEELKELLFALPRDVRVAILAAAQGYHQTMEEATYTLVLGLLKACSLERAR